MNFFSIFHFCRPLVDIYWHPLLKCDSHCLFLSYGDSCSACEKSRPNNIYIIIYTINWTVKGVNRNIRQRQNWNVICVVSFKNQNSRIEKCQDLFTVVIYPVDSAIHLLNNRGQSLKYPTLGVSQFSLGTFPAPLCTYYYCSIYIHSLAILRICFALVLRHPYPFSRSFNAPYFASIERFGG